MFLFRIIVVSLFLVLSLYAKNNNISLSNDSKIYFLPKEANETKENILKLIESSQKSIDIAMYNFSYKKFAKHLVASSKKGIKIKVILDKAKVKKNDKIYKYLRSNRIEVKFADEKLHTKIAIFDKQIAVLGSINWTKESFKNNYELVVFTKDKNIVKKSLDFIHRF